MTFMTNSRKGVGGRDKPGHGDVGGPVIGKLI